MKFTMPILAARRRAAARRVPIALHGRPAPVRDQVPARRDRRDEATRRPLLQAAAGPERRVLRQAHPARSTIPNPTASRRPRRSRCWSISSCCGASPTSSSTTSRVQGDEEAARRRLSQTVRANLAEEFNKRDRARGDLGGARQDHDRPRGRRPTRTPSRSASRSSTCGCAASSCRRTSPGPSTRAWNRSAGASPTSCARSGGAESEKIRADADRQRVVILADAYKQAQKIKGKGDAKASAIYAQAYGANPEFYSFYRSLEAYKATFRSKSDLMVLDPSVGVLPVLQAVRREPHVARGPRSSRASPSARGRRAGFAAGGVRAGAGPRGAAAARRAAACGARRFAALVELDRRPAALHRPRFRSRSGCSRCGSSPYA